MDVNFIIWCCKAVVYSFLSYKSFCTSHDYFLVIKFQDQFLRLFFCCQFVFQKCGVQFLLPCVNLSLWIRVILLMIITLYPHFLRGQNWESPWLPAPMCSSNVWILWKHQMERIVHLPNCLSLLMFSVHTKLEKLISILNGFLPF